MRPYLNTFRTRAREGLFVQLLSEVNSMMKRTRNLTDEGWVHPAWKACAIRLIMKMRRADARARIILIHPFDAPKFPVLTFAGIKVRLDMECEPETILITE